MVTIRDIKTICTAPEGIKDVYKRQEVGLFCENKVPGRPFRGQHRKGAGLPGEVCKIP